MLGYEVAFASILEFACEDSVKQPMVDLGVYCATADKYINIEEFVFLNAERISAFFLSRFNFGGSWIEKARHFCPYAQVIFNTVDLHHIREKRQAQIINDKKMMENALLTEVEELDRIASADITIVVSKKERDILEEIRPCADVRVIPLIREIENRTFPKFEKRNGIAFIGGFQHQPNIDAVNNFLDVTWPEILAIRPKMKFYVIGSNLPPVLSARKERNVEWVGHVDKLEPWLDTVRVTVAPLRFGAGAKGKVVSSLINGVPCIASRIAAEGMGIAEGDGIITAECPLEFAQRVVSLHDNEALWNESSIRGFAAVKKNYSIEHGMELVEQILPRISQKK
jgi:glycosyltransferase involved in cell wall biosynthesis